MTPEELKRAFLAVDSGLSTSQVDKYLCWAYRVTDVAHLVEAESSEQTDLIARLMNGNIKRSARK